MRFIGFYRVYATVPVKDNRINIKGNKDGVNIIIDIERFIDFNEVIERLINLLSVGKGFYRKSVIKITANFKDVTESEIIKLKEELMDKIRIKDCIFDDINKKDKNQESKTFNGIYEGRSKFIRRTIRSGQEISYSGNIVIIGDINSGASVQAGGNIIVLGSIKGQVKAGVTGNNKAMIAAFSLKPELLQITNVITLSPDGDEPGYPEVARLKEGSIVVEPYLLNKYI